MDFGKKLKIRLCTAIIYTIIGIAMIVVFNITKTDNYFLSSFGAIMLICGIARIRNYFLITKNKDTMKKREIAESDERNIYLSQKAKAIAVNTYTLVVGIAVIVLGIMGKSQLSTILAMTICLLVFVYWVSYLVISKK